MASNNETVRLAGAISASAEVPVVQSPAGDRQSTDWQSNPIAARPARSLAEKEALVAQRSQSGYTLQKIAEIAVVSPTEVRLALECGHSYVYQPYLSAGQTLEERAAQLQQEVGRPWRCKTCRPERPSGKERNTHEEL